MQSRYVDERRRNYDERHPARASSVGAAGSQAAPRKPSYGHARACARFQEGERARGRRHARRVDARRRWRRGRASGGRAMGASDCGGGPVATAGRQPSKSRGRERRPRYLMPSAIGPSDERGTVCFPLSSLPHPPTPPSPRWRFASAVPLRPRLRHLPPVPFHDYACDTPAIYPRCRHLGKAHSVLSLRIPVRTVQLRSSSARVGPPEDKTDGVTFVGRSDGTGQLGAT